MKNLIPIAVDEMRRRFALAEVDSDVFTKEDTCSQNGKMLTDREKEEIKAKLLSGNERAVLEAINQHNHGKHVYRHFILPKDVKRWYLGEIEASLDKFENLQVVGTSYWRDISNGTLKLSEAAVGLKETKSENPQTKRIKRVISLLETGVAINLEGIILLCKEADESNGPLEIIEGHARLVAICLTLIKRGVLTMAGVPTMHIPIILGEY